MARKGAMAKEPVLRGEARRAAKVARRAAEEGRPETSPPVRATPRREKAGERLSPGVYRGDRGGLVGQGGRPIQRQPEPQGNPWASAGGPQASDYQYLAGQAEQAAMQGNYMATPEIMQQRGFQPALPGQQIGSIPGMPQDKMFRFENMPQMPQPSANMGGQYRLSPGVYGTRDQAMQQYNQQLNDMGIQGGPMMIQPAFTPYGQRRG